MDIRERDSQGKTVCPQCGKHYYPILGERDPYIKIQEQFPSAPQWVREQLLTGICSQKCWEKYLGLKPTTRKPHARKKTVRRRK